MMIVFDVISLMIFFDVVCISVIDERYSYALCITITSIDCRIYYVSDHWNSRQAIETVYTWTNHPPVRDNGKRNGSLRNWGTDWERLDIG